MDPRIVRAVEGDAEALGELLHEHYDRIARFLTGAIPADLRSQISPEDVLQDTFIEAFTSIGGLVPKSDQAFARWLRLIAEHQLLDRIRYCRRKKRGGNRRRVHQKPSSEASTMTDLLDVVIGEITSPSSAVARDEAIRALQIHLASLPENYRKAVQLHHIEGLDLIDVADNLGQTPGAVRGLLYRARKKLRDAMGRSSLWFRDKQ